jgi:uncharacterized protein with HEPN domain
MEDRNLFRLGHIRDCIVELKDIWVTAVNDIPVLKKQIQDIISDLGGD